MRGKIALIQILLIITALLVVITFIDDNRKKRSNENDFRDMQSAVESTYIPQDHKAEEEYNEDGMLVRYLSLYQGNNDFVGWIKINDTKIDYPVMHNSQSNAYYLHRDYNRNDSSTGIPFLDYQCSIEPRSSNLIIYAHNMKNGTMFHDLLNYSKKEYYDSHKFVEFNSLYNVGVYEIFSVIRTKVGGSNEFKYYNYIDFENETEYNKFIGLARSNSLYETSIIPQYGDDILTLSTCSYNSDNERFVVFARRCK